ncbi:RecB family exonuclease [Chloroflexota bacterium]
MDKLIATSYNSTRIYPFPQEEIIRPLSFTQISLYQTCPLLYKLQYLDGLKTEDRWYLSFGTTMHRCTEYFFKVSVPPPPSLEELLLFYEQNWLGVGYESTEEEERYQGFGREILTRFWELHSAGFRLPLAVEKGFYLDIDGVKLRGFIDRVDRLESGGLAIIDYKTNRDFFTNDYLEHDLQLTLYQLAAEQMWRLPIERLTLYHLRSYTPCSCPPRQESQLLEARRLVLEVAENIARQRFPATENAFCPCDFPEHCPYHRHLYAPPPQQEILPGLAITDVVEEYARLQGEIKERQLELEELRKILIDFCRKEGLNRVYGTGYCVDYRLMEKTGFEEDSVRDLLAPLGLWERVLRPDDALLKELLTDAGIAAEIRQSLETMRRITSYPQLRVKKRLEEE